jgi:hypothetical protein
MLSHLRARILEALEQSPTVTLATSGPAGLQLSTCAAYHDELRLFLVVPQQSDHLVNLETEPAAAVTGAGWRASGHGEVRSPQAAGLPLTSAELAWKAVIEIQLARFEFVEADGATVYETIDIED